MKTYFTQLLNYDCWASKTLLDIFEKRHPANPRIYELLSHLCSTQRIWLDRCTGAPNTVERFMDRTPAQIQSDADAYHHAWKEFVNGLQSTDFDRKIRYTNFRGEALEDTISDILAHVINHGTHHRGSIIAYMKEEGYELPVLDYVFFKRLLPANKT